MRRFITADEIRIAARASENGQAVVSVGKDDIVTLEAKDIAKTLNVLILSDCVRRPVVCANFKMNGGVGMLDKYICELSASLAQKYSDYKNELDVIVAPPAPLVAVAFGLAGRNGVFSVGAQNCYIKQSGAYTGEVSPYLLKECGAEYVILGHSERRSLFGENEGVLSQKLKIAIDAELIPIFCVGENLQERNSGKTFEVLSKMLSALYAIPIEYAKRVIIAYEPIWAIGTGVNATGEQIFETCAYIRKNIMEKLGVDFSNSIRILYGGSVNDVNALEIANIKGVDGALVGGASLNASNFAKIVSAFRNRS